MGLFFGGVRERVVNEFEAAFEAGDAALELVDFAVEFADGAFAADEGFGGAGAGFGGVVDEGEVPLDGDAGVETLDLPLGDGDVADDGGGELVDGLVDLDELSQELVVLGAVFVAQDGLMRGEELGERVDVFAGFDGIGADFGFSRVGDRTLRFGAVFTGDTGSFFVGHMILLLLVE